MAVSDYWNDGIIYAGTAVSCVRIGGSKSPGILNTTDTDEVIEAYASMDELEGQLGGGFYRCHRGYLVNMAHIVR